jgi:hypothetical protein
MTLQDSQRSGSLRLPARSVAAAICIAVILAWLVTILAINGTIFAWLEGDTSFVPTTRAGSGVHGACFALAEATAAATLSTRTALEATGLFAGGAAFGATARGVGQSATCIKFLLTCGKGEFLVAISTIQGLVSQ